MIDLTR